jgi:arylsulfatase A-like enzyme
MTSGHLSLSNAKPIEIEAGKAPAVPRLALVEISLVAIWFGLTFGLIEAILTYILRGVPGFVMRASPEILWIAPVFDMLLFLSIGVGVAIVFAVQRKSPSLRFVAGLFSWMTLLGVLLLLGKIHQIAAVILSLGVGIQISRWLRGREQRMVSVLRRSMVILMIAAVLAGLSGFSWNSWHEKRLVGSLPAPPIGAPNLLLITLDTLRADHLSSYGYSKDTSPNIDRLAQGGALFENAFANSSWTLPSHASIFTGRLPHEHGADWIDPLNSKLPILAGELAARGYHTAAFAANTQYVTPEWGLARGFTRFEAYGNSLVGDACSTVYGRKIALNLFPRLGYFDIPGRKTASEVNGEFFDWLDRNGGAPFFVFLNYFDLHDPYLTDLKYQTRFSTTAARGDLINFQFQPEVFRRKSQLTPAEIQAEIDGYDACLAYLDAQLGKLFADLARRGIANNTLIIVTSDHGEAFGNHDLFGHGNSLYLETLRVPLIFYWPGRIASGIRFSEIVGLQQIPSTLMDLQSRALSASFPGESLAALLSGKSDRLTTNSVLSEVSSGRFRGGPPGYPTANGGLKSLVTDRWHLIVSESGFVELYDWREDPLEAHNLAGETASQMVVQQLRRQLEASSTTGTTEGNQTLRSG